MPPALSAIDRGLTRLLDMLVIALAGLLLVLLNYAVFARFISNASVSWGEELPAHLLAMLAFIGAAYLTRTNEHIGFDGVIVLLPASVQRWLLAFNFAVMALFGLAMAWYGGIAAWSFMGRMLISLDLPVSLFRGTMAVSALIITLVCLVRLVGLVTGRIRPADLLPNSDA